MKKAGSIQLKKVIATVLAAAVCLTTAVIPKVRLAADGEPTNGEAVGGENPDGEASGTDKTVTGEAAEFNTGTLAIWEWDVITYDNVSSFINSHRGETVASLFIPSDVLKGMPNVNDKGMFTEGIMSFYEDDSHVFHGGYEDPGRMNQVRDNDIYHFGTATTEFPVVPDFFSFMDTVLENNISKSFASMSDQYRGTFLKMDNEALQKVTIKELQKGKFYTTGNCLGALWVTFDPNNGTYSKKDAFYCYTSIALSKASFKTSYDGMPGNGYNLKNDSSFNYIKLPITNENSQDPEGSEPFLALSHVQWADRMTNSDVIIAWSNYDKMPSQVNGVGRDIFYLTNDQMDNIICCNNGYAFGSSAVRGFKWIVGTPHFFSTIKGENSKDASGKGGVTTVRSGTVMSVGNTQYTDASGHTAKSEGIILPEDGRIIIEEGGVLSIDGNFINNGTIINRGGTILVKNGATVTQFGETSQGTIRCTMGETGKSGQFIVMPGGKVECLADQDVKELYVKDELLKQDVLSQIRQKKDVTNLTSLELKNGSCLTCFGEVLLTRMDMDSSSGVEMKKDSSLRLGLVRKEKYVLMFTNGAENNIETLQTAETLGRLKQRIASGDIGDATDTGLLKNYAEGISCTDGSDTKASVTAYSGSSLSYPEGFVDKNIVDIKEPQY